MYSTRSSVQVWPDGPILLHARLWWQVCTKRLAVLVSSRSSLLCTVMHIFCRVKWGCDHPSGLWDHSAFEFRTDQAYDRHPVSPIGSLNGSDRVFATV